jgi:hypothetical protein
MIAAVVVAGNGCCQFGASVGQVIAAAQTEESSFIMVVFWWHRADSPLLRFVERQKSDLRSPVK